LLRYNRDACALGIILILRQGYQQALITGLYYNGAHECRVPCNENDKIMGTSIHYLRPLRDLKHVDARRNLPTRLVALSRSATQQMHASDHALRGLQASAGSALSLLNRPPACLRNDALILHSPVSQRP